MQASRAGAQPGKNAVIAAAPVTLRAWRKPAQVVRASTLTAVGCMTGGSVGN